MTQTQAASADLVGPYRVIRAIGAGGSARIDLAVIERAYGFVRHVVLKRPLEHLRTDAHVAETLRREAHLGGRLRHPNLVAVLDAGTHDGYVYLALEYVAGSSVRTIMQADEPRTPDRRGIASSSGSAGSAVRALPLSAALSIVVGAARGLHEAHELTGADGAPLGLVHRDVSPANILVDRDGTVKLSDFGIAKDTRVSTLSGSMRGTVTYMAPEQCRGHAFDRRADVFSLGVILHELISGRRLFWAENDVASLHKVLSAPLPDPRESVPSIAPELAAIAMRAIAREPADRIASAHELADRLEAFAARASLVLGARVVAPLIVALDTPVPSSKQMTAQIATPAPEEPSLVTVIESVSDLEEVIEPTFGPNASGDDEIATPVRQPTYADHLAAAAPARRSRRWLLGLIAACAIGGIGIGAWIAMRGSEPRASLDTASRPSNSTPSSTTPSSATPSNTTPSNSDDPSSGAAAAASLVIDAAVTPVDADEIEIDTDVAAGSAAPTEHKRHRTRPRPDKRPAMTAPVDAAVTQPASDAAVTKPVPDAKAAGAEWNPNIVLPSDRPK